MSDETRRTLLDRWMQAPRLGALAWILVPKSRRLAWCEARGEHKPMNVDGMRKLCLNCGTW